MKQELIVEINTVKTSIDIQNEHVNNTKGMMKSRAQNETDKYVFLFITIHRTHQKQEEAINIQNRLNDITIKLEQRHLYHKNFANK